MAKKYSQRWKVNGKFSTFKDFIKANGQDYVQYEKLSTTEKKIYNGLKQYEQRIVIRGKFKDNKELVNNPTLKIFAKNNNMDIKSYIKKNYDKIDRYMKKGVLTYSVNLTKLPRFINTHSGILLNEDGSEMTKAQMLEYLTTLIKTSMQGTKYFTAYVRFKITNFGTNATVLSITLIGSSGQETIKF